MKLYHGSYTTVQVPDVSRGRVKVDFGQGFYLTSIKEQAENWSRLISFRKGPNLQPVVSIFDLDTEALHITPEQALDVFYSSHTARQLSDPNTGLQLMSDQYILEDLLSELSGKETGMYEI